MPRDVSRLNNIMFHKKDDQVYGVLNDFDPSVFWKHPSQSTSKQRTGTKPFMARDLLVLDGPPAHLYRFDLESMFYTLLFAAHHYHDGKEIENAPYKFWEDLGTQELLLHKQSFFITNHMMELLYYNRSLILRYSPFNFIEDIARFLNLLGTLQRLTKAQWGYHPILPAPDVTKIFGKGILSDPFRDLTIHLRNGQFLKLQYVVFQSHGLIGRGTCVSRATMSPSDAGNVIVKWSWPPQTRIPEAKFIKHTVRKAAGKYSWVLNHLPRHLHSEEHEFGANTPQLLLYRYFNDEYELRELRIVVQEQLFPITQLTSSEDLGRAFYGIFRCYQWLYDRAEIMHRDISLNNLMFRRKGNKIYGVLNNFDLSVFRKYPFSQSTSKQCTGTEPYMARDLLVLDKPPAHLYRFDLESLFYTLLFAAHHYHDGKEIENAPFKLWEDLGTQELLLHKELFFSKPLPLPTPNFWPLSGLIVSLFERIKHGYNARGSASNSGKSKDFELDTLNGQVTFRAFEDILAAHLHSPH